MLKRSRFLQKMLTALLLAVCGQGAWAQANYIPSKATDLTDANGLTVQRHLDEDSKFRGLSHKYSIVKTYSTRFDSPTRDATWLNLTGISYGTDTATGSPYSGATCAYITTPSPTAAYCLTKEMFGDVESLMLYRPLGGGTANSYPGGGANSYNTFNVNAVLLDHYLDDNNNWYTTRVPGNALFSIGNKSDQGATLNNAQYGPNAPTSNGEPNVAYWIKRRVIGNYTQVKTWPDVKTTTTAGQAAGDNTLTLTSVSGMAAGTELTFSCTVSGAPVPQKIKITAINTLTVTLASPLPGTVANGANVYCLEPGDWQYQRTFRPGTTVPDNPDWGQSGFSLQYGGVVYYYQVSALSPPGGNLIVNPDFRAQDSANTLGIWGWGYNSTVPAFTGNVLGLTSIPDRFGITRPVLQFTQLSGSTDSMLVATYVTSSTPLFGNTNNVNNQTAGTTNNYRVRLGRGVDFPRIVEFSIWSKGSGVAFTGSPIGPVCVVYQYDAQNNLTMNEEGDNVGGGTAGTQAHGYVAGLGPYAGPRGINANGYERLEPGSTGSWNWYETRFRMTVHPGVVSMSIRIGFHETGQGASNSTGTIYISEVTARPVD